MLLLLLLCLLADAMPNANSNSNNTSNCLFWWHPTRTLYCLLLSSKTRNDNGPEDDKDEDAELLKLHLFTVRQSRTQTNWSTKNRDWSSVCLSRAVYFTQQLQLAAQPDWARPQRNGALLCKQQPTAVCKTSWETVCCDHSGSRQRSALLLLGNNAFKLHHLLCCLVQCDVM